MKELAFWSRGRVDGSHSEGPRFDPPCETKTFLSFNEAEAYYYVMIDTPNDMPSDLK